MSDSQVIRSKKVKIYHQVKLYRWVKLLQQFFSLHRYFIETTTTDIDMLLEV